MNTASDNLSVVDAKRDALVATIDVCRKGFRFGSSPPSVPADPYVRPKAVVSDRYDQLSLLRTIKLILGLDTLNLNRAISES